MSQGSVILYCQCAHSRGAPRAVWEALRASGVAFEAVGDLCGLAARRDPRLADLARADRLTVIACYPRTVKWLFAAAGADLDDERVEVLNMRAMPAEEIIRALLPAGADASAPPAPDRSAEPPPGPEGDWVPWFPVIDYDRCQNCKQCLAFCLFGVFALDDDGQVVVAKPDRCKTNCPACARVCPHVAIIFPKHKASPINGDAVGEDDEQRQPVRVDPAALLAGDVYQTLRRRGAPAGAGADGNLQDLMERLEVPPEVIADLRLGGGPAAARKDDKPDRPCDCPRDGGRPERETPRSGDTGPCCDEDG